MSAKYLFIQADENIPKEKGNSVSFSFTFIKLDPKTGFVAANSRPTVIGWQPITPEGDWPACPFVAEAELGIRQYRARDESGQFVQKTDGCVEAIYSAKPIDLSGFVGASRPGGESGGSSSGGAADFKNPFADDLGIK